MLGAQRFLCPQIPRETNNAKHTMKNKVPVFLPRRLGVDFINKLVTFLLSVEVNLTHLLL